MENSLEKIRKIYDQLIQYIESTDTESTLRDYQLNRFRIHREILEKYFEEPEKGERLERMKTLIGAKPNIIKQGGMGSFEDSCDYLARDEIEDVVRKYFIPINDLGRAVSREFASD